ncbi:MAG: hypothetical protein ACI9VS_001517 [Candidatus Binatia bacterium]|jgi:hypothetical protein
MKTKFYSALLAGSLTLCASASAQVFELRQEGLLYAPDRFGNGPNTQWLGDNGAPASSTPTPGQYQGAIIVSGVSSQSATALDENLSFARNAANLDWPRQTALDNSVVAVLRAQIGAPFMSRQVDFLFGSVVTQPQTDENGDLLPPAGSGNDYWLPEPHTANAHDGAPYYWSPHARRVFANQAGPVAVIWKKAVPAVTEPADFGTNPENYSLVAGNYFTLSTKNYTISGSAVKTPQKMYWTEGVFRDTGKSVDVPGARIGSINVVYNQEVPARVDSEHIEPGQTFVIDEGRLEETRTLWYDQQQGQIYAYNSEGRVFVEILGDNSGDGATRIHLGFEIVDINREPFPVDIPIELGEILTPYQGRDDPALNPTPANSGGSMFAFRQIIEGAERPFLHAIRKTQNLNDLPVHWLAEGVAGLRWPFIYARYELDWPTDPAKYSHYARPLVATEQQAALTSIKLPTENVPSIDYQDPLDRPRAKLNNEFKFFTFLEPEFPVHRTLLRYISGDDIAFERVFSWLETGVKDPSLLTDTLATNLTAFDPGTREFTFDNIGVEPRSISATATIGERILAPSGEAGANAQEDYLAGFIQQDHGDLFNQAAYVSPFLGGGFEDANLGAIIPVNTVPGNDRLEVHWFRANGTDREQGFLPVYWPSVIGRYTLQWPAAPREIVLASNDGSGPLQSLEATGSIYTQNDRTLPGFNPNEEHSLSLGGQVFALRDDLNVTSGPDYTSERFALLNYTDGDSRPAMSVFKVLREKPEAGITFNYATEAGIVLQPPMPLPLLPKPVPAGTKTSLNFEVRAYPVASSAYDAATTNTTVTTTGAHALVPFRKYAIQNPADLSQRRWMIVTGADHASGTAAGIASTQNVFQLEWQAGLTFAINLPPGVSPGDTVAVVDESGQAVNWVTIAASDGASVTLDAGSPASVASANLLIIADPTQTAAQFVGWDISRELTPDIPNFRSHYSSYLFEDRKNNQWVYRGPHDSERAGGFEAQYYYKTQAGFYFPGAADQPPVGTLTPYLRIQNVDGSYQGDAVFATTASKQGFPVAYSPVWPDETPEMFTAESLILPKRGLPAMRGQTSLEIVYQQSLSKETGTPPESVVLHDPTREKEFFLDEDGGSKLFKIPASAATDSFLGKVFFTLLPPYLSERFFFDPNRGAHGALVLKGEFVDEALGDDYLLLNVLSDSDSAMLKSLVVDADEDHGKWDAAIEDLMTKVETFYENPAVPGTYIPNPAKDEIVGAGNLAVVTDDDSAVDSYALSAIGPGIGYVSLIAGNGEAFTPAEEPVSILILKVNPDLYRGEIKVIQSSNPLSEKLTLQQVTDLAANPGNFVFDWRYAPPVDGLPEPVAFTSDDPGSAWLALDTADYPDGIRANWGDGASVKTLSDNYLIMRYGQKDGMGGVLRYSTWTEPALAEGWIKRVLAGINPFNQRVTDLFSNQVSTSGSILEQAGQRWEGNVALNLSSINNFGLIEIYETVLNRGRGLSIDAGINYGPANDALLLAAGYINDLYMVLGNEAWADAANPTIGISSKDDTFGDIATAQFAFSGQVPTLLEEELGLLRGRDDFLLPGVEVNPVYNRMVWNYTRGINAGEIIYALNYNIKDEQGENLNGAVGAEDAQRAFPQGHGDAYGHYLTATKSYYSLLLDDDFTWIPRIESVNVLGKPVAIDYLDERKFAGAASASARAARQIFDLTWRKDYRRGSDIGWEHFSESRDNDRRILPSTRHWGLDHWASRAGQGSLVNWMVGNSMLPDVDPDPTHEGIQKVDRTTVPELDEIAIIARDLQQSLDNADAHLNPLGLSENSIAFDISPNGFADGTSSHFEQIAERAKLALNNAVVAFDNSKGVNQLLRSEQDSLVDFQAQVAEQELAYTHRLVELFGTPYPDDIGPGKTYVTDYEGPDLVHFMYVDLAELSFPGLLEPENQQDFRIDLQNYPADWSQSQKDSFAFIKPALDNANQTSITYKLGPHGFFGKPNEWQSRRYSPGEIQSAASDIIKSRNALRQTLGDHEGLKYTLDRQIELFNEAGRIGGLIGEVELSMDTARSIFEGITFATTVSAAITETISAGVDAAADAAQEALPTSLIAGLAAGGDVTAPGRGAIKAASSVALSAFDAILLGLTIGDAAAGLALNQAEIWVPRNMIAPLEGELGDKQAVYELDVALGNLQSSLSTINQRAQEYGDTRLRYQSLLAKGDRIQAERRIFRQRASGIIQGFRTRDAAFRVFRNEKLERYKTLFDLAAQYTFLATQAFDYDTGLLHTQEGRAFIERVINSRALGVITDGQPRFAGASSGDPGLSSILAEMNADWHVLRGRLGFNNPDVYGTTMSLRTENLRIVPGADGNENWKDVLEAGRVNNLLADADVRRYCMQIDPGDGLPVPGIVLDFSSTIANKLNFFGRQSAAGDHVFSPTSFATKIHSVGLVLEGYKGMDNPSSNSGTTGGSSPSDPSAPFLDPDALLATPFIYLVPVGIDSMRSPPLGDQNVIRSWSVQDVTIPLPFNIGSSAFSAGNFFQSANSLTEPLFGIRKHQAFRPVSNSSVFANDNGGLNSSIYTNNRLIGRSVWNSKWKIVIPGHALLSDSEEGLDRFIRTVTDIKIHLETYSYAGN